MIFNGYFEMFNCFWIFLRLNNVKINGMLEIFISLLCTKSYTFRNNTSAYMRYFLTRQHSSGKHSASGFQRQLVPQGRLPKSSSNRRPGICKCIDNAVGDRRGYPFPQLFPNFSLQTFSCLFHCCPRLVTPSRTILNLPSF